MQRLEVSGAVRPIYGSLGVKRLNNANFIQWCIYRTLFIFLLDIKAALKLQFEPITV